MKTKSILVCAVLASVLGGGVPVYAEGETPALGVQHRYQLQYVSEWSSGDVSYGHIVQKNAEGQWCLYKIVTGKDADGNATPWGRGLTNPDEDKRITLQYDWHTADTTDGINHLVSNTVSIGDITLVYDGTKVVNERQTEIDDSVTAYVGANSTLRGGALYNSKDKSGTNILADFIGNYASGNYDVYGGAIYNNSSAQIGNITGDFIGNYASGRTIANGGAIYNNSGAQIGNITGDFIGNYASSQSSFADGGAVYNESTAKIGNIIGDFIGNYATSSEDGTWVCGGAIYNNLSAQIGNIISDFIGNYASSQSNTAQGGAIYNYNVAQISNITGDFIGNYVSGNYNVYGGAICNDGRINNISGNFIGNYASGNYDVYGGAIYNKGTITILAGDRDVLLSGNRVSAPENPSKAKGGAIYNDGYAAGCIVNLYAAKGHDITFEGDADDDNTDSIYNRGTLNINDTENNYTGTVNLAKVEGDGTMNINGGTVNMRGNVTQNTLNISGGTVAVTGTLRVSNITFTLPTGVENESVIINATNAIKGVSFNGVTVDVYLNGQTPNTITLINNKVTSTGSFNVYTGTADSAQSTEDYTISVDSGALVLKSLNVLWYTVGDDEKKFLPSATSQSISGVNDDVTIYRGTTYDSETKTGNEYASIDATGHNVTIASENPVKVTGELKANSVAVGTGKGLIIDASNLKSDVTNSGTVNLGAGTLATGSTITGGTLNINDNVTANAGDIAGETNTVAEGKTLTFNGGTVAHIISGAGNVVIGDGVNEQTVSSDMGKLANTGDLTVNIKGTLELTAGSLNKAIANSGTVVMKTGSSFGTDGKINGGAVTLGSDVHFTKDNLSNLTTFDADSAVFNFSANVGATPSVDQISITGQATDTLKLGTVTVTGKDDNWKIGVTKQFSYLTGGSGHTITISNTTVGTSDGYKYIFGQGYNTSGDNTSGVKSGYMDVFKDNGASLKETIEGAAVDTYVLVNDYTETEDLGVLGGEAGTSMTVEGNGHKFMGGNHKGISVGEGKTLILDGMAEISGWKDYAVHNGGTLKINGQTGENKKTVLDSAVTSTNGKGDTEISGNVEIGSNGSITQKDLTIDGSGSLTANADKLVVSDSIVNNGEVKFTGGTVGTNISGAGKVVVNGNVTSAKNIANRVTVASDAKFTANGGTVSGMVTVSEEGTYTVTAGTQQNTVVNKGVFDVQGGTVRDYTVDNKGTMNVSGGTVTSDIIVASGAVLNISGGTVKVLDNKGTTNVTNMASLTGHRLYNDAGVVNFNANGILIGDNIIDGGTLNVNANVSAKISDMMATTTNIASDKYLTLAGSGTLSTNLTGAGNVVIGDGQNTSTVIAELGKFVNSGDLTVKEKGTLETAGNNGQLGRDIKGDGTVKLTGDTALVNGKSIQGILDSNGKNVTLVSGTAVTNTIDTFTVGALTGSTNLGLDVDMSNFASDKIVTTTFDGTVTVDSINVTKDIVNNPLELSKEENNKIVYLDKTTGNGTTFVKDGSITVTNNYKYTFTGGDVGKLNYKVEAVALIFKKFIEGNLSGNITMLSLTEDLANSGDGSTTITQVPATVNINLNGHTLSSAEASTITVPSGKILNVNGCSDVQNAGVVDANTDFIVAGTLAVSGNTDIKGDITNNGAVTFAGTTVAEGSLNGVGDYSNSGSLTLTAGTLAKAITNSGTVKLNGAGLGGAYIIGGILEFATNASYDISFLTGTINRVDSGVTLALSGGSVGNTTNIENQGTVDLVSGTYDETFVANAKDSGTVNLKDEAVYQTTAGKVFTEGDAKGKIAGAISQDSGSAAGLLNFVAGTLTLTDEEYSLDYLVSAKDALNKYKYDGEHLSQTQLVMTGTLIAAKKVSMDTIIALGGGIILKDVEVTSDKANLIIGKESEEGYGNAVVNGFGAGSLNLGAGTDKITVTNGKELTLGGTEGGTIIKVNDEEKNVNVNVGQGNQSATFNIGNEAAEANKPYSLTGDIGVNKNSVVNINDRTNVTGNVNLTDTGTMNVKGDTNITQALNMAGGKVAVAKGAELNVPAINVTANAQMSGKIVTENLTGNGKVIIVGNADAAGHLNAAIVQLNYGMLFLDPVWKDDENLIGDATHVATQTTNLDGAYVVGRNSILTFGATNEEADAVFGNSGFTWGNQTGNITAAAYVAKNINVANGSLTVDGSLEAPPTAPATETVNLAANSLLMVKGDICGTAAVSGISGTDINEGANLYITNAQQNVAYKILAGSNIVADKLTPILPYGLLLDEEKTTLSGNEVTVQFKPDRDAGQDTIIPNIIKERDGELKEYVTKISDNYVGDAEKVAAEINNYANLGENLGVSQGAYDVANMVGDAIDKHWEQHHQAKDVWASGTRNKETVEGVELGGMNAQYEAQYNGAVVGVNWSSNFGMAINYTDGKVNNRLGGHNDAEYYGGSLYAKTDWGNLGVYLDATYTYGKNELSQNGITADAKTETISGGLTLKYMAKAGLNKIGPFAGIRYMHIKGREYTDSLGVNREADKINSVVVPTGLEYTGGFEIKNGNWTWKPRLAVGYLFNLGKRDNDITIKYNGAKDIFGYDFADNGAFFANAGVVFERKNFGIGLGYEFMKSKNSRGRRWNVNMDCTF